MRRLQVYILVILFCLSSIQIVLAQPIFTAESFTDELDDAYDFNSVFNEGVFNPLVMPLDIITVSFTVNEPSDGSSPIIGISSETIAPPLPHMSYTWEYVIDVDKDPTTGVSEPSSFYNGLGAEYDIGVEVTEGEISSTWIEIYQDGSWTRIGEPNVYLDEMKMNVEFPVATLGVPFDSSVMIYLISEGGLDMAPGSGLPPINIKLHYEPEALITSLPIVDEGVPFELDASKSVSLNGHIVLYEWDLDGDGTFEESHTDSMLTFSYSDDGVYEVTLRVTDEYGFVDSNTIIVESANVPPNIIDFSFKGETRAGEEIQFSGDAVDVVDDPLTYDWDFGDGTSDHGKDVTHTYTTDGEYTVILTVTDDEGDIDTELTNINIETPSTPTDEPEPPKQPEIDPLLIILVVLFGIFGWFFYDYFFRKKDDGKKKDNGEKDWCEEHPEVVEEEQKKCDEALEALDDALGPLEEKLESYRRTWRDVSREVGRQISAFDIAYPMVASLTSLKTIAKEGVEQATEDFAKDMAKDAAKNAAGGMSQFLADVMSLEEWAMSEIGIGLAKFITGIDPQAEASRIREASLEIVNQLETWISSSHARNAGIIPPITLHDYIDDAQALIDDINEAVQAFEDAVANFRCVDCSIDGPYSEHIRDMINELN
ncbi:MAG: PKD domain-containing protein, partial [Promethearchaeota archaeon]